MREHAEKLFQSKNILGGCFRECARRKQPKFEDAIRAQPGMAVTRKKEEQKSEEKSNNVKPSCNKQAAATSGVRFEMELYDGVINFFRRYDGRRRGRRRLGRGREIVRAGQWIL